jgi:hypothetical protein
MNALVIVPTYETAVAEVIHEALAVEPHVNILVVDDGSPDPAHHRSHQ